MNNSTDRIRTRGRTKKRYKVSNLIANLSPNGDGSLFPTTDQDNKTIPSSGKVGPVGDDHFRQKHLGPGVIHGQVIGTAHQRHTEDVGQLFAVDTTPILPKQNTWMPKMTAFVKIHMHSDGKVWLVVT